MNHQVVLHYRDGRILKGITGDFLPHHERFHVTPPGDQAHEARLQDLKAVFFVRDLVGDSRHQKSNVPIPGVPLGGRRLRVVFEDGEVMVGATEAYHGEQTGFFLTPVDLGSNNARCFVVAGAAREIQFI